MNTAAFENMEGSHGTSAGTRKELPKECQTTDNDGGHGLWRIALYYIYIEMTPSQVKSHIDTQKRTCEELGLKGRIRVSEEGVNAVLSGLLEKLYLYENIISRALQKVATEEKDEKQTTTNDNEKDSDTEIDLDIKYCELRSELPVAKQKFDRLIVKETKNVIGLFDQSGQQGQQQKYAKSEKYRRKRERKRQQQEARRQTKIETLNQLDSQQSHSSTASSIPADGKSMGNQSSTESTNKQDVTLESDSLDMTSLYQSVMEEPLKPARHLSAMEWNEKLDQVASSDKSALLLDVRNVYEMKVGHFVHPSTPTLLTNTRKYSDLPQILASNEEMKKRDQIFMYCTGGVRCERVSMLVHELYPEKEIFQLQGGIQRYLESCSERNKQQERQGSGLDSTGGNINYFDGKNFVFDPRRTDPIHFGKTVGKCLVCKAPHDDYDNGHAPSENKEARCNNCRMLILICNKCRPKYRCHGEKYEGDDGEAKTQQNENGNNLLRPLLYCNLDKCIHEGSIPEPTLRIAVN